MVRIVARKLDDGRVEFALQQRQTDSTWGDRQRPRARFFPTTARVGRWLASSPLESAAGEVRIVARRLGDGRVEFALQQRRTDSTWGDRQRPRARFFPTTARVGRWLASSPLTLSAPRSAVTSGGFSAVAAGDSHSCGLRAEGTITCWGRNDRGQADAPPGRFSALTTGAGHSCGLRTDGTITCWGRNDRGQADAPAGRFSALTTGAGHSCGLRADATVTCWGANHAGQADAPAGRFNAVFASGATSCGQRSDDTITCWGNNRLQAGRRAERALHRRHRRQPAQSCAPAHRRHHHLLGPQPPLGADHIGQAEGPAAGSVAITAGRLSTFVRLAHRRHHHLLGRQPLPARPTMRRAGAIQRRSPPATTIRAPARHARQPSPAGATTTDGQADAPSRAASDVQLRSGQRRHRWRDLASRAPCAPTAPSPAGAGNDDAAKPSARRAVHRRHRRRATQSRAVCATDATITCWGNNHDLLGQAGQARHSGQFSAVAAGSVALLRAAHRRHHHLLGQQQHSLADVRAGSAQHGRLQRHHRRRVLAFLRVAHRRHHHLLGHTTTALDDYDPQHHLHRGAGRRARRGASPPSFRRRDFHSCGLRTDGTITCWGHTRAGW